MTTPPIKISDEALEVGRRAGAEVYARWNAEHPAKRASFASLITAVSEASAEAAAPLIAAQVLRTAADELRAILADDDAGPPEDHLYRIALWAAGKPGVSGGTQK